jgi:hypothetical protein
MQSTYYYCQILMKTEFSKHIFEKSPKHQISRKPIQREPSCSIHTDGQMYAQTGMMKLIVTYHNFVNVPKKTFTTTDKQFFFY